MSAQQAEVWRGEKKDTLVLSALTMGGRRAKWGSSGGDGSDSGDPGESRTFYQ